MVQFFLLVKNVFHGLMAVVMALPIVVTMCLTKSPDAEIVINPDATNPYINEYKDPDVSAHRSGAGVAPQNTLMAFENIVEKSITRHLGYISGKLTINDGEFYGKANSSAGGCFFCGAATDCAITLNGGKFTSLWTSGSVNRIFESYYGGTINVTGGLFNTNGGIATFVEANTDAATKDAYPYVAK